MDPLIETKNTEQVDQDISEKDLEHWKYLDEKNSSIENLLITLSTGTIVLLIGFFSKISGYPLSTTSRGELKWSLALLVISIIACFMNKILDYYALDYDPYYKKTEKEQKQSYKTWKKLDKCLEIIYLIELVSFFIGIVLAGIFGISII